MSIKESSDELNPPVITADAIPKPKTRRSSKDYLALAIATCGVGYLPLAPGTWGSTLAVAFYLLLQRQWFSLTGSPSSAYPRSFVLLQLVIVVVVTFIVTWAATRTERVSGRKDPGKVVVDEVAGQLVALIAVPAGLVTGIPLSVLAAFILFRTFDIVKPYPAHRLEALPGGLGIMADDLIAGVYAGLGVLLLRIVGFIS